MRAPRIILIAIAATTALGFPSAMAENSPSQRQLPDPAVQADRPHCARWTDECVNCTRDSADSAPVCSNIGMACQPKSIRCLADAPVQEPSQPK